MAERSTVFREFRPAPVTPVGARIRPQTVLKGLNSSRADGAQSPGRLKINQFERIGEKILRLARIRKKADQRDAAELFNIRRNFVQGSSMAVRLLFSISR